MSIRGANCEAAFEFELDSFRTGIQALNRLRGRKASLGMIRHTLINKSVIRSAHALAKADETRAALFGINFGQYRAIKLYMLADVGFYYLLYRSSSSNSSHLVGV
jgi:hypothetical protein